MGLGVISNPAIFLERLQRLICSGYCYRKARFDDPMLKMFIEFDCLRIRIEKIVVVLY
jgi:hypothetical protein